jgi:hypothetical protein
MAWYKFVALLSHWSYELNKKIQHFIDALHSGFWLGVMSERSLEYSDELFYNQKKHYTDDKYNQSGLYHWEKAMIEKHFKDAKKILLIAAGGGRELIALHNMGFDVTSYECNTRLIVYGNELLLRNGIRKKIEYLPGSSVPELITEYDGIIIGWGAYSLINGRKKRLTFLDGLLPFLKKEAPLMISFLFTRSRTRHEKTIRMISNFFRTIMFRERTETGDMLVPDFIHYFTEEEIKKELIQSKFKVIDYSDSDYGCLIANIQ